MHVLLSSGTVLACLQVFNLPIVVFVHYLKCYTMHCKCCMYFVLFFVIFCIIACNRYCILMNHPCKYMTVLYTFSEN